MIIREQFEKVKTKIIKKEYICAPDNWNTFSFKICRFNHLSGHFKANVAAEGFEPPTYSM